MGVCCSIGEYKVFAKNIESRATVMSKHTTGPRSVRSTLRNTVKRIHELAPEDVRELSTAVVSCPAKSPHEVSVLLTAVRSHFILRLLDASAQELLVSKMLKYTLGPDEAVYKAGQASHSFLVLTDGLLIVYTDERTTSVIKHGSSFGENAVLEGTPRTETVVTAQPSEIWGLDLGSVKEASEWIRRSYALENQQFLENEERLRILTSEDRQIFLDNVVQQQWNEGQKIVARGTHPQFLYCIKQGSVFCSTAEGTHSLGVGEVFGEIGILHESLRTADIVAAEPTVLLSLDEPVVTEHFGKSLWSLVLRNCLKIAFAHSALQGFTDEHISLLSKKLTPQHYVDAEVVIPRGGKIGDAVYVVLKGKVRLEERVYVAFDCICDRLLYRTSPFFYKGIAEGEAVIVKIPKEVIEEVLGGNYFEFAELHQRAQVLQKQEHFRFLSFDKLKTLAKMMSKRHLVGTTKLFRIGEPATCAYLVAEGNVELWTNSGELSIAAVNECIDIELMFADTQRNHTAVALGAVIVWVISKKLMQALFSKELIDRFRFKESAFVLELDKLRFVQVLDHSDSRILFQAVCMEKNCSLVYYPKQAIINSDLYSTVTHECAVLKALSHPLVPSPLRIRKFNEGVGILSLYSGRLSFQSYIDLKRNCLDETAFYVASMISILEHLHSVHVVHRNFCPRNLALDQRGHLHLINCGTARFLDGRSYSVVGEPLYLAPEAVRGEGYSARADWWALGVIAFELVYGSVPFDTASPAALYESIAHFELPFSFEECRASPAKACLAVLLQNEPSKRLPGGVAALKKQVWFQTTDWQKIHSLEIEGPFKPRFTQDFQEELMWSFTAQPITTISDYDQWHLDFSTSLNN